MPRATRCYRGFGVTWRSDIALDLFDAVDTVGLVPPIEVCAVHQLAKRGPSAPLNHGQLFADGLRLGGNEEVVLDLFEGLQVAYLRGPGWTGTLPAAFYGTAVALTLAWRGAVPFHASAVEIDGRAILLCGAPGAGKSTLVAQLLDHGARLLSDDLSVIECTPDGPIVCRGRSTIRLHRETADRVAATTRNAVPDDPRDKWIVRPLARSPLERVPLAGFVLLGEPNHPIARVANVPLLARQLFRPRWLAAMPGNAARLAAVLAIAAHVPVRGADPPRGFHADDVFAGHLLTIIAGMTRSAA